ncbi:hypothetical protein [Pseudomonas phage Alpheus]|uniref:Uncharacterized protein n=1 Tax=Pseudomonas phage Alpheus TaxID=2163983 RepID=A0A2S1GMZ9_9CAUD|nr:hypothetical protein HOT11_gp26 [Pseudomonas phage Alpheus]AWD90750.1 hypothetical protein [Pseudomonas phage Alpheus]
MTQYETFKEIFDLAQAGKEIPQDLREQAAVHGLRVDAIVSTVASLSTATGEDDLE